MTRAGAFDWWFRSRVDGRVVVAQAPNPALTVFLVALGWRAVADPSGGARQLLDGVVTGSLIVWALDEVVRGVNPWRRLLGAVVLVPTVVGAIARIT